jgi:hypothetical protein
MTVPFFFADACNKGGFFGLPHWWQYLNTNSNGGTCNIVFNPPGDFLAVGLALIDILLRVAGIVAVFAIIYAGVSYMNAMGNADKANSARKMITNSLIGLGIVIAATTVVTYVGGHLQ